MFKLKSKMVEDAATGLKGYLTHMYVEGNGSVMYRFQPYGLNKKTGEPMIGMIIARVRIKGGEEVAEPDDMPNHILNTEVEEITTGFKGTVTSLCLHESGCVHAVVQPKGINVETGQVVNPKECNVRDLKGKAIKVKSENTLAKEQKKKPSPMMGVTIGRFC